MTALALTRRRVLAQWLVHCAARDRTGTGLATPKQRRYAAKKRISGGAVLWKCSTGGPERRE